MRNKNPLIYKDQPMTKQYVFYHNDMDGKAAAFIIHSRIIIGQLGWDDSTSRYQKFDHNGSAFNMNYVDKSTIAYVVDISFTESNFQMLKDLCEKAGFVIWLDHHASSVDLVKNHNDELSKLNLFYYVDNNACGALLAYAFSTVCQDVVPSCAGHGNDFLSFQFSYGAFYNSVIHCSKKTGAPSGFLMAVDKGIPEWLCLLDDYDRMQKRHIPGTDRFILGCEVNNTGLATSVGKGPAKKVEFNSFWANLVSNPKAVKNYVNDGRLIQAYLTSRYNRELPAGMFEWTAEDGTVCCCLNSRGNSWNFQDEFLKYDACILFNMNANGTWKYSVYSNDNSSFNCAKFCEGYGGGGHFHAAGFVSEELIFIKRS